ncbi:hypothetical protein [Gloeocapsopsis dulcis]|uniref:Secreted protein n=1 Tax=Gloeocapsopsis dulcis AAB1 = 1H9 TaxID=1433147 RepID=A0A6N8FXI5_9CHRO|nr:hypothetical protein [Gloeocapsopsis dulcis]MUL37840.1 hypothetical protein [Gloeocapsopsis dulcis AAB1 = 1H9]WNN89802.1 hypothetical protein P0S91_01515 [Gloeocapsopsis dulcis]
MKLSNLLLAVVVAIASFGITVAAQADTVNARCEVYPKGERATSSGSCTFSQRQGVVGIQLKNGRRYDLRPVGNQPGNYRDQNGRAVYRQSGLGDQGQIYRLANESIYVYWDTAPYGQNSGSGNSGSFAASSHPAAGTPVDRLSDLVGARAGQVENTVEQRGYQFIKPASASGDAIYTYWRETRTNYCVTILTEQGRYESFAYATPADCK